MKFVRLLAISILLILFSMVVLPVLAADCPTIIKNALDATNKLCSTTGRNQACYGSINLSAAAQADASSFTFAKPGDLVSVDDIKSLTLSSLDTKTDAWGVALIKLQADLLDAQPQQNVTLALFGDVQVDNAVKPTVTLDVTTKQAANVRQTSSKTAAVAASAKANTAFVADGRSEDSAWLRVHSDDATIQGWISAPLVKSDGDLNSLAVVNADAPRLNPMQAFHLQTGLGDAPCGDASDSGVLIQAPKGATPISLTVNNATITLDSTAYIQAKSDGDMTINILQGQGIITAADTTVIAPAGSRVRIPLDDDLNAKSAPVSPEPYDDARLASLPLSLLPETIKPTPALTVSAIATATASIQPTAGTWTKPAGTANLTSQCGQGKSMATNVTTFTVAKGQFDVAKMVGTSSNVTSGELPIKSIVVKQEAPNTYVIDIDSTTYRGQYTLKVLSPTKMHLDSLVTSKVAKGCVITASDEVNFTGK
jgi:hypothetical protein